MKKLPQKRKAQIALWLVLVLVFSVTQRFSAPVYADTLNYYFDIVTWDVGVPIDPVEFSFTLPANWTGNVSYGQEITTWFQGIPNGLQVRSVTSQSPSAGEDLYVIMSGIPTVLPNYNDPVYAIIPSPGIPQISDFYNIRYTPYKFEIILDTTAPLIEGEGGGALTFTVRETLWQGSALVTPYPLASQYFFVSSMFPNGVTVNGQQQDQYRQYYSNLTPSNQFTIEVPPTISQGTYDFTVFIYNDQYPADAKFTVYPPNNPPNYPPGTTPSNNPPLSRWVFYASNTPSKITAEDSIIYQYVPYKMTIETDIPADSGAVLGIYPSLPNGLELITESAAGFIQGVIYGAPEDYYSVMGSRTAYTVFAYYSGADINSIDISNMLNDPRNAATTFDLTIENTPDQQTLEQVPLYNAYPIAYNQKRNRDGHIGTYNAATGQYEITGYRETVGDQYMYIEDRLDYTGGRSNYELFDSFWIDGEEMRLGIDYLVEPGSAELALLQPAVKNLNNGQHVASAAFKKPTAGSNGGISNELDTVTQKFTVNLNAGGGAGSYGDINGDSRIDSADLVLFQRYFAQPGVSINQTGGDCNGDGRINNADLILLKKHFAQPNVRLGPATL